MPGCTNMHRMQENKTLVMAFNLEMIVSVRARKQLSNCTVPRHTWRYQMEEIRLRYSYIKLLLFEVNRGVGKKGICRIWFIGADIFLPHCLVTGIWNLAPKAITGPKSRGTSFNTTLWQRVQRDCALCILFAHAQLVKKYANRVS